MLLFTTPAGAAHPAADRALAGRSAALVDAVLRAAPVKRLAVAGGDTSSRIARKLGIWGLAHHARIAPGVSLCRTRSEDPARDGMLVMLKGGQMGDVGLFDRFAGLRRSYRRARHSPGVAPVAARNARVKWLCEA